MGMIGFTVGFIGFLLHQITELIADFKWEQAKGYIEASIIHMYSLHVYLAMLFSPFLI